MRMVELRHDLNISFKLQTVLAPRLLEMLKLLNLPFCELMEKIEQEAEENPVLEIEKPEILYEYAKYLGSDKKPKKEVDYSQYDGLKNVAARSCNLREHLLEQLKLTNLKSKDFEIAEDIINHIDSNGYLKKFDAEISGDVERVLKVIQTFEPDGVGARDLKESLLIQVREYAFEDPEIEDLLRIVVEKHLDKLGNHEYKKIADAEDVLEQDIIEVARFVKENLTPYPAAGFSETVRAVMPSFAIEIKGDKIKATNLEERYGPRITISSQYEKMLRDPRTDEKTVKFLKNRLEKAMNIIEDLSKRQETGSKIMELIAEKQADFFKKGKAFFKPLLQKEIAEILGLHPSTISRAVSEKYVQTQKGLFPLKYLCPREISGFSAFEIKNRIKQLISEEDRKNPYPDSALLEILKQEGMRISRRTVSTFRKELEIKAFKERKV